MSDQRHDLHRLKARLATMGRHLRLRDGLRLAAYSLWIAVLLAALIELACRQWPIADRHLWATLPLEIWFIALALYSLLRPLPQWQVARRLDKELGLKDRLATALELQSVEEGKRGGWEKGTLRRSRGHPAMLPPLRPANAPTSTLPDLCSLQLGDALASAQRLSPGQLAWRIPRRPLWLATILFFLALALALLPNPMDAILAEQAAIRAAAAAQAKVIEETRREFEQATEPTAEERAEALRALTELMKALSANPGDREQALADISATQEKLGEFQNATAAARQAVAEQIATRLTALSRGQDRSSGDLGAAGQALAELARAMGHTDQAGRDDTARALESIAAQAAATDADLSEALLYLASAVKADNLAEALNAANTAQAALTQSKRAIDLQQTLAAAQNALENSRQQLAGAGGQSSLASGPSQGQSSGQGQQGQNQGQSPGQGQQGQNQGSGQSPGGGGGTTANQLLGANRTGTARNPTQPNRPASLTDAETIYAPDSDSHVAANPDFVAGRETDQGQTIVREEGPSQGAVNPALVPYREVYQRYADAAAETMERDRVPPEWENYVRDYFSRLAPE